MAYSRSLTSAARRVSRRSDIDGDGEVNGHIVAAAMDDVLFGIEAKRKSSRRMLGAARRFVFVLFCVIVFVCCSFESRRGGGISPPRTDGTVRGVPWHARPHAIGGIVPHDNSSFDRSRSFVGLTGRAIKVCRLRIRDSPTHGCCWDIVIYYDMVRV